MSDFLDLPTLIAIGVIIVVFLRLRSVLGSRTGNERPPSQRIRSHTDKAAPEDNVVPMRPTGDETIVDQDGDRHLRKVEAEIEQLGRGDVELGKNLMAIAQSDPGFTPKSFLEGAKSAYEMVVTAFASGDRKTLKMLLEKDVYEGFEQAITQREQAGQKVDFTFVGLPGIEITEAEFDKKTAQITIKFSAEVVSATHDASGALVEGNVDQVITISDEWTFARSVKSRDPNWKLVATNQLD